MDLNEAITELRKVLANSQHTKGCDCKECVSLRCVISFLVSKVNIEKIVKAMDSIKYQKNWQGTPTFSLGEIMTDGDIQRIAKAIVKEILGKE